MRDRNGSNNVSRQASNARSSSLVVAVKKKAGRMSDERKGKEEKEGYFILMVGAGKGWIKGLGRMV